MFNYFRKELDWGGRKLVLETGKIARQADGARDGQLRRHDRAVHRGRREDPASRGRISSR